jgi:hypothetical protein
MTEHAMNLSRSDTRMGNWGFAFVFLVMAVGFALIRLINVGPMLFFGLP